MAVRLKTYEEGYEEGYKHGCISMVQTIMRFTVVVAIIAGMLGFKYWMGE